MEDLGLDLWSLDLDESLRPWQENGLAHILCKDPVPAPAHKRTPASSGPGRPVREPGPPSRSAAARTGQTPPARPEPKPSPPPGNGPHPDLPAPFTSLLDRTAIPSFTLWTYWEFGQDLLGPPNPDRQTLWRGMLKALHDRLGWPRGSIAFWPLSTIRDATLVPDMDLFLYGVKRIKPVYVFCFGRQAFKVLFPNREYAPGRYTRQQLSIQVLPGPEEMLPDNKAAKAAAWKTFQRYTPS